MRNHFPHASNRRLAMLALALPLAFAMPAYGEDAHHPEKSGAAPAVAASAAPAVPVAKMQANVKKMQAQLDRIGKAKTDAERQQLMDEHQKTMQENMHLAGGAKAPMMKMMDCEGMHGAMVGAAPGGGEFAARLGQVEKRLDALEQAAKPDPAK